MRYKHAIPRSSIRKPSKDWLLYEIISRSSLWKHLESFYSWSRFVVTQYDISDWISVKIHLI